MSGFQADWALSHRKGGLSTCSVDHDSPLLRIPTSGLGSTVAQGMAFGTGSAVAHRAVDSIMGPRTVVHEQADGAAAAGSAMAQPVAADACVNQSKAFQDCVNANNSDIGKCQFYVDMLTECRRSSQAGMVL